MDITVGKKYLYRGRNSVFEVVQTPAWGGGFYLVYYDVSGEFRRYSRQRILDNCDEWTGPVEKKKISFALGGPRSLAIDPIQKTVSYQIGRNIPSQPVPLQPLIDALKKAGLCD